MKVFVPPFTMVLTEERSSFSLFDDPIPIDNEEEFEVIVQDFKIEPGWHASRLAVPLPSKDIRKLELKEVACCYDDGSVLAYEDGKKRSVTLKRIVADESDAQLVNALSDKYKTPLRYLPQTFEGGWSCLCGGVNDEASNLCLACGRSKESVLECADEEGRIRIMDAYERKQKESIDKHTQVSKTKNEVAASPQKSRLGNRKTILFAVGIILAFVLIISMARLNKPMFLSAEIMEQRISAIYIKDVDDTNSRCIRIIDGRLIERKNRNSTIDIRNSAIISWDNTKGSITLSDGEIVVVKVNDKGYYIVYDGDSFFLEGGWTTYDESKTYKPSIVDNAYSSNTSASDTAALSFKFSNLRLEAGQVSYKCTGSLMNASNRSYRFVKVRGQFKNASGQVVDTAWTYAVGAEGLYPGESTSFTMYCSANSAIQTVEVMVMDAK